MVIGGLGRVTMPRMTPPRRAKTERFKPEAETEAADGPVAAAPVSMPSLLGLQEAQGDAARDREARQHADEMLDALGELQRALLAGSEAGGLERMAQLGRRTPQAADPRLAAIQHALMVRVAVEQARNAASG